MKNTYLAFKLALVSFLLITQITFAAGIDMQSHVASDAGKAAYTTYVTKQTAYYKTGYTYAELMSKTGATLFGALNQLMGETNKIAASRYDYGALRYAYSSVDKDLNNSSNFISYYNGASMNATWDSGSSWNREHTWPQSKFEGSETTKGTSIPIGYDMQSVRPASTSVNSDRGNTAYGEGSNYYDPNDISISNSNYTAISNGTYRGDCARVILYDYITYGKNGTYYNNLYLPKCKTDLLVQVGSNSNSVFESLAILLKWHMQDPPSLTEMTRNDGGEVYQGNRNPFIDYPELAINMLKDATNVTDYTVTTSTTASVVPNYQYTTPGGFVTYLTYFDGTHPAAVTVTGGTYKYEATLGRLTISSATGAVTISTNDDPIAINYTTIDDIAYYAQNGTVYVSNLADNSMVSIFDCAGRLITKQTNCSSEEQFQLSKGVYVLQVTVGKSTRSFKIAY
jgi:endonuclease I